MYLDAYALFYAAALIVTMGVAVIAADKGRMVGVGFLSGAWLLTVTMQWVFDELSSPVWASALDVFLVWGFCLLARFNRNGWAWLVGGLHILMLLCHPLYAAGSITSDFIYLSLLADLGYASMLVIVGPPLALWIGKASKHGGSLFMPTGIGPRPDNSHKTPASPKRKAAQ